MRRMTRALEQGITLAAAPGGVQYTERQLYYELCRVLRPVPGLTTAQALAVLAAGLIPAGLAWRSPRRAALLMLADVVLAGGLRGLRAWPYTRPVPLDYDTFREAVQRYRTRCGEPPGLLPDEGGIPFAPGGPEPDLLDYGVDQVLVCQRADIARMLLANMFHMEAKCAVVSLADGLPPALRGMLARTPQARVLLLHDASAEGLALVTHLRERLEVPEQVDVAAVGLRPVHARRLHLFATRSGSPALHRQHWPAYLLPRERAWLERGWCAEVSAVQPARLLLKLRRIVTGNLPPAFRLYNPRRDREIGFMTWPEA